MERLCWRWAQTECEKGQGLQRGRETRGEHLWPLGGPGLSQPHVSGGFGFRGLPSPRVLVLAFFRNFIDLFDRYLWVDELWRQGRGLGLVGLVFCREDRLLSAPTTDLSTSLGGSGGHSVAVLPECSVSCPERRASCVFCVLQLGSVACSPVDCPITCTYPFHPDGECCPVCRGECGQLPHVRGPWVGLGTHGPLSPLPLQTATMREGR